MKDCFGTELVPGDIVMVVVPIAPLKRWTLHCCAKVVERRGRRIGIRFHESDYARGIKTAWPDSIRKFERQPIPEGPGICQACRNPEKNLVCLCGPDR